MSFGPSAAKQFVAVVRRAGLDDPWSLSFPEPVQFCWDDAASGVRALGAGVLATWEGRGGSAWDEVDRLHTPVGFPQSDGLPSPYWIGAAFDPDRFETADSPWVDFPTFRWVLPRFLAWREAGETQWCEFARVGSGGELAALRALETEIDSRQVGQALAGDRPRFAVTPQAALQDAAQWGARVAQALKQIEAKSLSKVVLARTLDGSLTAPPSVADTARALAAHAASATVFVTRGRSETSLFAGVTPERLIRLRGRRFETEALASSSRVEEIDTLARGDKEKREHASVVQGIREALGPFCSALHVAPEARLLKLPYVAHLRTQVSGELKDGVRLGAMLGALAPTSAVGGEPGAQALAFLRENEPFDRGWYAGTIGFAGPRGVELRVAIRSALFRATQVRLFVGAGIVRGSSAESEWAETENKARAILEAIAGGPGAAR
ncbi:MAG: isochorismate synthase MenF [Myxococcaceae bacterium]